MEQIPFRINRIDNQKIDMHPELVNPNTNEYQINTRYAFTGSLVNNVIGCRGEYRFYQGENEVSCLIVDCYFDIDPLYVNQNKKEDGSLTVDKEFLRYLATINVGTARGIQHVRTQNTILNDVVIPPINLTTLELNDIIIKD